MMIEEIEEAPDVIKVKEALKLANSKEDIAQILKHVIDGLVDDMHKQIAINLILASRAFKGEDYSYYLDELASYTNDCWYREFVTICYLGSNKFRHEDLDRAFQADPWYFIVSKHFTLEIFEKYYYVKSVDFLPDHQLQILKQRMLAKISEL